MCVRVCFCFSRAWRKRTKTRLVQKHYQKHDVSEYAWRTSAWVCYICSVCELQLTQTPNLVIITTNELHMVTYSFFSFFFDTSRHVFSVKISFPLFLQKENTKENTTEENTKIHGFLCFYITTYRCLIIITNEINMVISTFSLNTLLSSQDFIYTLTYLHRLIHVTVLNLHMPNYYNQWTLYHYPYHFSFPDKSSLLHYLRQN